MSMTSTQENEAFDQHERIKIYNDIQMLLAGRSVLPAIEALADSLTVAIIHGAPDLKAARECFARLTPIMARAIDNNWEILLSRKGTSSPAGNA